jgi:SPP1 family predicted phage head-tail adaptor
MRAGDLRHRITILHFVSGKDEDGLPTKEWRPLAEVWAAVGPLQGREFWQAKAVQAESTVRVRIRYVKGWKDSAGNLVPVSTKLRVQYGDRVLGIESVIDSDERHVELQLLCKEVEPGG